MAESEYIEKLEQKIALLETRVKHLTNDLRLTREENEISMANYFDLFSNMENQVEERTRQLRNAQKILIRKGKELEFILDSSPAIIFYKDVERRFIRTNKKFTETIGIPVKKIIGKKFSELFPEYKDNSLKNDMKVIEKGEPLLNKKENLETPNGLRKILIDRIPYKNAQKQVMGFSGFASDITDLEIAEQEKKKLEKQLQRAQKMETIGTLAGGVAHDLNNVLTGIVSYPDIMLMNIPEESPLRKPILAMKKSGEKAAAIVQDLLTLARRGVVTMEVLNLNDIIIDHMESLEHEKLRSYHPEVEIEANLEKDLLYISGSPVHLSKVVMNLISNAAEAMPAGGMISISTESIYVDKSLRGYDSVKEGDYVILKVADTGIGIIGDDMERIFEPFYTKKKMGRSGTGLGMAVVWGTVKDHNGYIDIQSTEEMGTTFTLYFPATRDGVIKDSEQSNMQDYMGNGESILVVDDIKEQRNIALSVLRLLGYSPHAVTGGQEAIAFLREQSADLVLLDMIMDPGIDGLDTYKKILEIHPKQKAIIVSGFSETERVKEAQRMGAGKYLRKPYTMEKLGISIKEELVRIPSKQAG